MRGTQNTAMSLKRRRSLYVLAGVLTSAAIIIACGADSESAGFDGTLDGGPPPSALGDSGFPFGDGGVGPPIRANAVVIVHAARLPAFRLCFTANAASSLPTPSQVLMPDSNIVGVEVGSAVRVPPIANAIGDVYAIPEEKIRPFYPPGTTAGPKCDVILSQYQDDAIKLGAIDQDISSGVNLLVVGGCLPSAKDPTASVARCGGTWNTASGNVSLKRIPITAYTRTRDDALPVQLMQLSPALAARANGQNITLAFGDLEAGAPSPVITDPLALGALTPPIPTVVQYTPNDTRTYLTTGFSVAIGGTAPRDGGADAGDAGSIRDGGGGEVIFRQSLADIGQLSSSRVLPSEWFSIASSYVLLLIGDDSIPDGGSLDRFHLLAVPVARPNDEDGGPELAPDK